MIEYQSDHASVNPIYDCVLCKTRVPGDEQHIITHLKSLEHRLNYFVSVILQLLTNKPEVYIGLL